MLDLRYDDMPALLAVCLDDALERKVVGFRAARGKVDFLGSCPEERSGLGPCLFNGVFRLPADVVQVGRVAELVREEGQHGLQHLRMYRRRRCMIEIDFFHANIPPSLSWRPSSRVSEGRALSVPAAAAKDRQR